MSPIGDAAPGTELLAAEIQELRAALTRLTAEMDDLAAVIAPSDTNHTPATAGDPYTNSPAPLYESLETWVISYFASTFARPVGGDIRWCTRWQEHPEALTRLEALWRSWEALRLDPNIGLVTWLTNYLDPQLASLFGRSGTFAGCTPERHGGNAALLCHSQRSGDFPDRQPG